MIILGIESSCDETSIAILENGSIIKNKIFSQQEHAQFGGVVPEIASRAHLDKVDRLTQSVLNETTMQISDIDLIAVTDSPGLAGALLVGISFALGIHTATGIPITGINHLEGHICSVFFEHPQLQYPFLALVVSGGHTAIYKVIDTGIYECLGETVDDAAGEAFDKVGKLIGFPYPAGRAIEQAASTATIPNPITFPIAQVSKIPGLNFSFSGLKTAVKYYTTSKDATFIQNNRPQICAAFQNAVIESLVNNLWKASLQTGISDVALVGGVACNGALRSALKNKFDNRVFFPVPALCTDNAAMIALAGYHRNLKGLTRFPRLDPSSALQ
jgi:N6-L-threonylcarbamoyladenine synthase